MASGILSLLQDRSPSVSHTLPLSLVWRALSFPDTGLHVGTDKRGLPIREAKLPPSPGLHVVTAPVGAHDALSGMGVGTQQKVAKFMGHRKSQKLRGIYFFLIRPRLDVAIENARIDTAAASVAGHGSSEDVIGEDPPVILGDDRQEQPVGFGRLCTDRGHGRAAAIGPFQLDARLAQDYPGSFLCCAQYAIRYLGLIQDHHGDP